jgi:hypothetical protein
MSLGLSDRVFRLVTDFVMASQNKKVEDVPRQVRGNGNTCWVESGSNYVTLDRHPGHWRAPWQVSSGRSRGQGRGQRYPKLGDCVPHFGKLLCF